MAGNTPQEQAMFRSRYSIQNPRITTNARYAPAPAADGPKVQETQALQTQLALAEVGGAQERLNMTLGSVLDQRNKEFFTTQDIRQTQATGAEERLRLQTVGEQERAGTVASGEQQRLGIVTTGEQERATQEQRYAGEKMLTQTRGEEERKTQLQSQMENRYIAQRNHDWAQRAYQV